MNTVRDQKLFLIDAFALIYRAYFAFSKNPRITSHGLDTSAIYGFTNMLLDLINKEAPSHIGVVFDTPKPTHRHIDYSEYKANRDAMPEGISIAIPYIKKILNSFNIPILFLDGFEADDVIGTLAKQANEKSITTYMMTPDKDFAQLVGENTFMYRPGRAGSPSEIWGPQKVCEKFNIDNVSQVVDFLAMVGDTADNIPGIPGVGPKTASRLIKLYGSVEGLYDSVNLLGGKLKEKVINAKDQAFLSKKLAKIILDAPITLNLDSLVFNGPNLKTLNRICDELEFKRIFDRIYNKFQSKKKLPVLNSDSVQLNIFDVHQSDISSLLIKGDLIDSISSLQKLIPTILQKSEVGIYVCFLKEKPLGISISQTVSHSHYIIFNNKINFTDCVNILQPVLESPSVKKLLFDSKFLFNFLNKYYKFTFINFFDISIADYLIHSDSNRSKKNIISRNNIDTINFDLLNLSNLQDIKLNLIESSISLFKIKERQIKVLENNNLLNVFSNLELPLVNVLLSMENNGIKIDIESLKKYSKKLTNQIQEIQQKIFNAAGENFNISSPKQLGEILFNKMKLSKTPKKTKSGQFATSESELIKLKGKHKIINDILIFRTHQKLLSTYVNALPLLVNQQTKKIHTTFNQTITSTGRLSSSNPNLQNIPIRKQSGKDVRKAFIPTDDNHILMAADYSQIELRLIAALSQEKNMIHAFSNNQDIHSSTASKVFNVDLKDVTYEMRSNAKVINFGIIYGVSAFGLSEQSTLTRREASDLIQVYFETYPNLNLYIEKQINFAKKNGYVATLFGRKRELRNINSRNSFIRGHDERNAVNMPIQGTAADLIKLAMIRIQNKIVEKKLFSKMVLQVHDELVFDVLKSEKETMYQIVKGEMENVYNFAVPLKVDIGFGLNWLEAH
ncbi:MAG: DNA polymerase I [Flavobacteriales bacterium]|nr:DNA polymerase I [Flavobacteriales bacterium]